MADGVLITVDGLARKAYGRGRADAQQQRNLRIAIRQLERAELYLVALNSLDIDDEGTEESVDELLQGLRGLQRYLSVKLTSLAGSLLYKDSRPSPLVSDLA